MRIIYNIEDYFEKIVLISDKAHLNIRQTLWKTTSDIKRSIWGLDLLIWMRNLDEEIDQISIKNDDQQLVNAWWNVRVEMEIFHDSLALRPGGYEGIEKPGENHNN